MSEAIRKILEPVGGNTGLAKRLRLRGHKITPQAISQWEQIPAERAKEIAEATDIPLHDLRPDLWTKPENAEAAE